MFHRRCFRSRIIIILGADLDTRGTHGGRATRDGTTSAARRHPKESMAREWKKRTDAGRLVGAQLSSIQGRACSYTIRANVPIQMVFRMGLISPARFASARTIALPSGRYDRNFDLTSIYRGLWRRTRGTVHSCLSRGANNSVGGAAVTFVISMAECFRVPFSSWSSPVAPISLSLSLSPPRSSKGLGEIVTIGEVTGSPVPSDCTVASVVSRLGAKGARNLFVLVVIGRRLLLLLPPPLAFCSSASAAVSSLRNKVTAERSATLKPRAGNGSRRPEAKYVPRILSDRDGGGAVLLCFCTRTVYRSRSHP